ncbi:MAG: YncE family protein [Terracidiphilus sp.]
MKTPIKGKAAWRLEQGANVRTSTASSRGTRLFMHLPFLCIIAWLASVSVHAQSFAYVANNGSNNVSVIHTAMNTVAATGAVGIDPQFVAVTLDRYFVYVTNTGSNSVLVIDTTSNTVVATVEIGNSPYWIAITPNGALA